jgi:hypothetical protein
MTLRSRSLQFPAVTICVVMLFLLFGVAGTAYADAPPEAPEQPAANEQLPGVESIDSQGNPGSDTDLQSSTGDSDPAESVGQSTNEPSMLDEGTAPSGENEALPEDTYPTEEASSAAPGPPAEDEQRDDVAPAEVDPTESENDAAHLLPAKTKPIVRKNPKPSRIPIILMICKMSGSPS